jgi:hypothetical protein
VFSHRNTYCVFHRVTMFMKIVHSFRIKLLKRKVSTRTVQKNKVNSQYVNITLLLFIKLYEKYLLYIEFTDKVERNYYSPVPGWNCTTKPYKVLPIRVKYRSIKRIKFTYLHYSSSCREPGSSSCIQLYQRTQRISIQDSRSYSPGICI